MLKSPLRFLFPLILLPSLAAAQAALPVAPARPGPDSRYKADILLIVAHPDDETLFAGYLAKAIFDEHKRVAAVYGTRGNAGGDTMSYAQASALGAEREIEARRAMEYLGVMNVWFLDAPDTPGDNVLRSLETWNHGSALEKAVRYVRLTRPEVIISLIPDFVVGENHEDHQAAGVIATEAFDLAGNPLVFPEQLAAPRDRLNIGNLTEGLQPWQPQKIYYVTDASHLDFTIGKGAEISMMDVSPSRHVPYYKLLAEEAKFHLTQDDSGDVARQAIETGDYRYFMTPEHLIFGKSLVGGSITGDPFEGVTSSPLPYRPATGYRRQSRPPLAMELGGPWAFYRRFWPAHDLTLMPGLLAPEIGVGPGERLYVPLLLHNDTNSQAEIAVTAALPAGWTDYGEARYPVPAHGDYPVEIVVNVPANAPHQAWSTISFAATSSGQKLITIPVRIFTH
jgi:LmbE family N-acetylglucosaminyl deacetylase